jgi:excisionase family DNA binding protein
MGLDNLEDILTIKELTEFLKVSESTIKRALKSGELQGFKVGRDWRIEREAVIKWINQEK